jgi:hypothetical protein
MLRYAALRSMPYSGKDRGNLYYARDVKRLRTWEGWVNAMEKITPQMWAGQEKDWGLRDVEVWIASQVPYFVASNPAIFPLLRSKYIELWSNSRYMLLRHPAHTGALQPEQR